MTKLRSGRKRINRVKQKYKHKRRRSNQTRPNFDVFGLHEEKYDWWKPNNTQNLQRET